MLAFNKIMEKGNFIQIVFQKFELVEMCYPRRSDIFILIIYPNMFIRRILDMGFSD